MNFKIDIVVNTRQAERNTNRFRRKLVDTDGAAKLLRRSLLRLGAAFIGFRVIGGATKVLANFEQQMAQLRAVTNATDKQMELFSATAQELGRTTVFTATQVADGLTILSRAGFTLQESTAAIPGTLRLAQAAGIGLAQASDITASALRGFRLEATKTDAVVDILAKTSTSANTTIAEIGEGLKFVAPIAAGLGVSLKTTSAAMGVLSDSGLKATLAGTGLRRVLAELESPAEKTRQILAQLGLTADDVRVSQVGLVKAVERLADAGIDTGRALQIFGQRGGPAFEVLSSNIGKVKSLEEALGKAEGTTKRMADTMNDTLKGSAIRTVSALQGFVLVAGKASGVSDVLRTSLDGLADAFNFLSEASGAGLAAAQAESALSPVGAKINSLRKQIKSLERIGANQGFLSEGQSVAIERLKGSLDNLTKSYRNTVETAKAAAKAEEDIATKRAIAAAKVDDATKSNNGSGSSGVFDDTIKKLREQNELLTVSAALGEQASMARAIEQDIEREGITLTREQRALIKDLIDQQEALNGVLDERTKKQQRINDQNREAAAQKRQNERNAQREQAAVDSLARQINIQDQLIEKERQLQIARDQGLITIEQQAAALAALQLRGLDASTSLEDGFSRAFARLSREAEDFAAVSEKITNIFADRATEAIVDFATTGKFAFKDFANAVLQDLVRVITRLLVVQALSAAFGGGAGTFAGALAGRRAEGGTVQPARSYVVGEKGPELFTPGQTGTITPNGGNSEPAPAPVIQVVNVQSEDDIPNAIDSGNSDDSFVNMLARNKDRVNSVLR